MVAGMVFAAPMVYLRVTDHTDVEDETMSTRDDQCASRGRRQDHASDGNDGESITKH